MERSEIKVLCAYKEMVDINSLQANPLNANKHPEDQIEVFKKIILYNGVRRPITVSTRSGYITKGHGEWETLKALGMEKVPVDFQDYDSEMQEIADMNADNALSRMSYLDTSKMQELVIKLDEANFDLELAGIPQSKAEILATQPPEWFSENPDPFKTNKPNPEINFSPGTVEDQGKLDQRKEFLVNCPGCSTVFDAHENPA